MNNTFLFFKNRKKKIMKYVLGIFHVLTNKKLKISKILGIQLLVVICCLLIFDVFSLETTAQTKIKAWQGSIDFYQDLYDNYDETSSQLAMPAVLTDLATEFPDITLEKKDIVNLLDGRIDVFRTEYEKRGEKNMTYQELGNLMTKTKEIAEFHQDLSEYQMDLSVLTGGTGFYSDGKLDGFDLLVDLQKLEVIWFGEKSTLRPAQWSANGNDFLDDILLDDGDVENNGNSNNSNNNSSNSGNNNSSNINTNRNSQNSNRNGTINNNNTNSNDPLYCAPGTEIWQQDPNLTDAVNNTLENAENLQEQRNQGNQIDSNQFNPDVNIQKAESFENREYVELKNADPTEESEEEESQWKCDGTFCVIISTKVGHGADGKYTPKDNSIFGHITFISEHLKTLNSYALGQKCTTKQFFGIGSNIKDLASHLRGLQVFISKKPVARVLPSQQKSNANQNQNSSSIDQIRQEVATAQGDADYLLNKNSSQENPCDVSVLASILDNGDYADVAIKLRECTLVKEQRIQNIIQTNRLSTLQDLRLDEGSNDLIIEMQRFTNVLEQMILAFEDKENGIHANVEKLLDKEITP